MKGLPRLVLAASLGVVLGCSDSQYSEPNQQAGSAARPATEEPGSFGAGVKVVGKDITPGTYRTRVRAPGCYWARLAGFSGELGDILANGNESGPMIVTIGPSDKAFESRRCGRWSPNLSAITPALDAPFTDGVFIVGTDVAAGTWRGDAPESCYWARLRGFSGALGDITANANGKAIVTIAESDQGFATRHCGAWSKVD